jgi:hypothetical protein
MLNYNVLLGLFFSALVIPSIKVGMPSISVLYPEIARLDKINPLTDKEFGVGDDDINNLVEPNVMIEGNNRKLSSLQSRPIHDYNLRTSWIGRPDVQYYITYVYDLPKASNSNIEFNKVVLFNGNRFDINKWHYYSRKKKILMYINDKPNCYLQLADTYKMQTFHLKSIKLFSGNAIRFKFQVIEIYQGVVKNPALSELKFE